MSETDFSELRASADKATSLMKALANPDRLILLCQLSGGEKSVGELENLLDIKQPTLSQQLGILRDAELVKTRRDGKNIYYNICSGSAMAVMQVLHQQICGVRQQPVLQPQIIADGVCANPQIRVEDVTRLAMQGFKTIITLRPDGEGGPEQPGSADIAAACKACGIVHHYIPVIPGNITPENVSAFEQACAASGKPILAYCKTGGRATNITKMSNLSKTA
jgi:ArsR family transcriptional regulator